MDLITNLIWTVFLGVLAIWAMQGAWRSDPSARMPLGMYWASYVLTSLIAVVIIGVLGADRLDAYQWGIDLSVLDDCGSPRYWLLAFGPLIVPSFIVWLFAPRRRAGADTFASHRTAPVAQQRMESFAIRVDSLRVRGNGQPPFLADCPAQHGSCVILGLIYLGLSAFCFAKLIASGYGSVVPMLFEDKGDFVRLLTLRTDMMQSLGFLFYCLVYTSLPAVTICALYHWHFTKRRSWQMLFFGMCLVTVYLNVGTVQKAPLLVFLVQMGCALVLLRRIPVRIIGLLTGIGLLLLFGMQTLYMSEWSVVQTVSLLFYRVGHSFPYYVHLYPNHLPHFGIDMGLHVIGIGTPPRDNLDVFAYMYPGVRWIEGASAAAAHVRAYAQAGSLFAFVTLIIIGISIILISRFRRYIQGPVSFAIYVQLLVYCYYLTQVSLIDALLSSYGVIWGLFPLLPYAILRPQPHMHAFPVTTTGRPGNNLQVRRLPRIAA